MARKSKDWYWECDSEKVLADQSLRLVQSPDGWPDFGLACVGLYWLMLNVMHCSPKLGYLLNPNTSLPMTTAELASIVGRPVPVVEQIQAILVSSGLFTVDTAGTIYSRGMVKRQALRVSKQRSGRKGGNPALLKQKVNHEVNHEVKRDVRVRINSSSSKKEELDTTPPKEGVQGEEILVNHVVNQNEVARSLAEAAAEFRGYKGSPSEIRKWETSIRAMLADGITEEAIEAELLRIAADSVPGRPADEPHFRFSDRLRAATGKTASGKQRSYGSDEEEIAKIRAEREARLHDR